MSLKTIIILSPHPDDECLGLAGTILKKKSEGYRVVNVIITTLKLTKFSKKLIYKKQQEKKNCKKIFKIDKTYTLDFKPTTLNSIDTKKIINKILQYLKKKILKRCFCHL